MHGVLPYVCCVALLCVGFYAIAVKKNLVKAIMGVILIDNAINMFLVLVGYRIPAAGAPAAPIETLTFSGQALLERSVDPLPQALILTSIVIGLAVTALMVVMAVRLHQKYGTFDLTDIRKLKG